MYTCLEIPSGPEDFWSFDANNISGEPTAYGRSRKLSAANMSISQWDHYYFRSGAKHGYQVAAVQKTPGLVGVWNLLRPWGDVKTG